MSECILNKLLFHKNLKLPHLYSKVLQQTGKKERENESEIFSELRQPLAKR